MADLIATHFDHKSDGSRGMNISLWLSTAEMKAIMKYLELSPVRSMRRRCRPPRKGFTPVLTYFLDTEEQWNRLTAFYPPGLPRKRYWECSAKFEDREIPKPPPMNANQMWKKALEWANSNEPTRTWIAVDELLINKPLPNSNRKRRMSFQFWPNLTPDGDGELVISFVYSSSE
jgi:hypothetical protein